MKFKNSPQICFLKSFALLLLCLTPSISEAQIEFLEVFPTAEFPNNKPSGTLIEHSSGYIYGTTPSPGSVFRIASDGTVQQEFCVFGDMTQELGLSPPVEGSDGAIYVAAMTGGPMGWGAILSCDRLGHTAVVFEFTSPEAEGQYPSIQLLVGEDGALYGTAKEGGLFDKGTVFRFSVGEGYEVIADFEDDTEEYYGTSNLVLASDGTILGVRYVDLGSDKGILFRVTGNRIETVFQFEAPIEQGAMGEISITPDGWVWGTTVYEIIWRVSPTGRFEFMNYLSFLEGQLPQGLRVGYDGSFYGVAQIGGRLLGPRRGCALTGTIYRVSLGGQVEKLHTFIGFGSRPHGSPLLASDGYLYGATLEARPCIGPNNHPSRQPTLFRLPIYN